MVDLEDMYNHFDDLKFNNVDNIRYWKCLKNLI